MKAEKGSQHVIALTVKVGIGFAKVLRVAHSIAKVALHHAQVLLGLSPVLGFGGDLLCQVED